MAERLFVYGTLHPDRAPGEIVDLVRRFNRLGTGTVHGRVYDLGEYPAMVLDRNAGQVKGEVFTVPPDSDALDRLDEYEDYHPTAPTSSLFVRQKTKVTLENGERLDCWVYVYNKPLASVA